jgi:hypothetical protein
MLQKRAGGSVVDGMKLKRGRAARVGKRLATRICPPAASWKRRMGNKRTQRLTQGRQLERGLNLADAFERDDQRERERESSII